MMSSLLVPSANRHERRVFLLIATLAVLAVFIWQAGSVLTGNKAAAVHTAEIAGIGNVGLVENQVWLVC